LAARGGSRLPSTLLGNWVRLVTPFDAYRHLERLKVTLDALGS